jgi:hypothetical protein
VVNWTTEHLSQFFDVDLHLPQYCSAIQTEEVSGAVFLDLYQTEGGLSELGITSKLHLSRIKTKLVTLDTTTEVRSS